MSNGERQRILREAGSRPAEAEKQEDARRSRERLGRLEGEPTADESHEPADNTPLAEDDEARPRPRR
ncbi:MAG: hypothetical protein ACJ766_11540 [Thermoleophilaceae bacterium]|jgi:hypothetical protein